MDYRALVVPPSILENEASVILRNAVSELSAQPDSSAIYREIHNLPGGNVTLIFRVIPAEKRFVGLPGSDPLSDRVRRPIEIFEGLVVEGLFPHITITKEDFQIVHEQIEPIYKNFWEKGRREFPTKPSHFFFLSSESNTNKRKSLGLLVEPPYVVQLEPARPSLSHQDPIPASNQREDQPYQEDIIQPEPARPSLSHQDPIPASNQREDQPRREDVLLSQRGDQRRVILISASLLVLLIIVVVLLAYLSRRPPFFPTPTPTPIPTYHTK